MEQLCIDDALFGGQMECERKERYVFDLLRPSLLQVLERNFLSENGLSFFKRKNQPTQYSNGSTVKYAFPYEKRHFGGDTQTKKSDAVAFSITVLKTKAYFSIPSDLHAMVPEEYQAPVYSSSGGYMKLDFESTQEGALKYADYLCRVLDAQFRLLEAQIDAMPGDFSCCSRVEECSNARKCVNPFPDLAIGCGYRRKLKQGIIFYGVNQNA